MLAIRKQPSTAMWSAKSLQLLSVLYQLKLSFGLLLELEDI